MTKAHRVFTSLLTVGVFLTFFTASASAEQKRVFEGTFGGDSSTVTNPYPLASAGGFASVAVDEKTGDVYVVDEENHRVEKFSPKGEFLLMFGKEVNQTAVLAAGTEAEQNLCTAGLLDICQAGTAATTPGAFTGSLSVAVDNSSGPSGGDVYVADETNVVSKFDEDGALLRTWGDAGPSESPDGQLVPGKQVVNNLEAFGPITGITVDDKGNLWVDGAHQKERNSPAETPPPTQRLFEFKQDGSFITAWAPTYGEDELELQHTGIVTDAEGDVYVPAGGAVLKFEPSGRLIGVAFSDFGGEGTSVGFPDGFTVDSADNLFAISTAIEAIKVFGSCQPVGGVLGTECTTTGAFGGGRFGSGYEGHLAVDSAVPTDTVYSSDGHEVAAFALVTVPGVVTGRPSGLAAASATLNGVVKPAGIELKECFFEWGETESYGHVAPCEHPNAGEVPQGSGEYAVHAAITGLHPGGTYHYRLVATNANDLNEPQQGADLAFGPPLIDSESSTDVAATSATVNAEVDPQNVATRVRFEYGTTTDYGQSTPVNDLAAGGAAQNAPTELQGLAQGTLYHYRVVAENALGEGAGAVIGPDRTFTTQSAGVFGLPDGRQWELVSPPDKRGAVIQPIGGQGSALQAAASGGAFTYAVSSPVESEPAGYDNYDQVLSMRGASGWSSQDIGIPHSTQTGLGTDGQEYKLFSEDLAGAVVQPFGAFTACHSEAGVQQPCLSPEASEQTAFLRNDYSPSGFCTSSCYQPLVTGCPPEGEECTPAVAEHADTPAGTVFGTTQNGGEKCGHPLVECGPLFEGATQDLQHIVVKSPTGALTKTLAAKNSLYEWSAGKPAGEQLQLVSVLPNTDQGVSGELGAGAPNVRHAISSGGSLVVWGTGVHLYLRNLETEQTIQLDAGLSGEPLFQTASADLSRVFFTDSGDLYEYDVPSGKLNQITENAEVRGTLLGAAEDGSNVYFVANAVLGDGAQHGAVIGTCPDEEDFHYVGECNLYVSHDEDGTRTTRFIAVLATADQHDWSPTSSSLVDLTARVSPSGEWLAFMSDRSPTGYDNRDAGSGQRDQEVYEYNAAAERLVCASCNPTGARPHGKSAGSDGKSNIPLVEGAEGAWAGTGEWIAANIPGWTPTEFAGGATHYQSRYLSDTGRLFFDASDALVPKDVNSQEDVYEFEPEGLGNCTSATRTGSDVFSAPADGCVGLISSGTSSEESAFLDASELGGDVFFLTASKLAPQDVDSSLDVYDAHECTSASPCSPQPAAAAPPCGTTEECRAAPESQPPIFDAPSSATFSGAGNIAPPATVAPVASKKTVKKTVRCAEGKRLSHGRCVKGKSKKKTKKARRAGDKRRVSS